MELQDSGSAGQDETSNWEYIPDRVKKLYDDKHYQQAVLDAFKYIETQVRDKGNYSETELGVKLMRRAFDEKNGNLANADLPEAEKQAQAHLFAGAIGFIRNPISHHDCDVKLNKATELLYFANYLLRILDGDYSERS